MYVCIPCLWSSVDENCEQRLTDQMIIYDVMMMYLWWVGLEGEDGCGEILSLSQALSSRELTGEAWLLHCAWGPSERGHWFVWSDHPLSTVHLCDVCVCVRVCVCVCVCVCVKEKRNQRVNMTVTCTTWWKLYVCMFTGRAPSNNVHVQIHTYLWFQIWGRDRWTAGNSNRVKNIHNNRNYLIGKLVTIRVGRGF